MAGILQALQEEATWQAFLDYKLSGHYISRHEKEQFTDFVQHRKYLSIAKELLQGHDCFQPPLKREINKSGTTKKRVVYTFSDDENLFLKGLGFLLYRYDPKLSDRCFSFRKSLSARDAIFSILSQKDRDSLYCFKADISNYFNSIPEEMLVSVLEDVIDDDPQLLWFLRSLLLRRQCRLEDGSVINESHGAMAGIPISPFFANIYLLSVDKHFENLGISYFRYSDDVLIFARTKEELDAYVADFRALIEAKSLALNPKKISISAPSQPWEFLGFCYAQGQVDISRVTKDKLKGKIRRKARALLRWKTRNDAEFERAGRALIRTFNRKFYNEKHEDCFTWSRWFFPVITTDKSLSELDAYLLEYVRYLFRGRHFKGNYKVTYEEIKKMGFRSLRHEYYISRKKAEVTLCEES